MSSPRDFKGILLDQLGVLEKAERQAKNPFKARAYAKVLQGIRGLPSPIQSEEEVLALPGVGDKLRQKIQEIFQTGELHQAKEVQQESAFDIRNQLLQVYGIGPVKAKELTQTHGIRTLAELRTRAEALLNDKQRLGLLYYDDLLQRIPRTEMKQHEKALLKAMRTVDDRFVGEVVGSFRRGATDSGDIDFLVKLPASVSAKDAADAFQRLVQYLMGGIGYMIELLAVGSKKCMGIARLPGKPARRLDVLLTPEHEYPYAVLYFTGSDKFNVQMRRHALERGYTMNEHGMKPVSTQATASGPPVPVPPMKDEKDIFQFLEFPYRSPHLRVGV